MSAPSAIDTTATAAADLSTASTATASTSSSAASSLPSASSLVSASSTSESGSASLIDEPDEHDADDGLTPDDTTNIALRTTKRNKSKRRSSLTSPTATTTATASAAASGAPLSSAPSLLRGLSLKSRAVQSTLSKGLSVALQYTKEKIGQAGDVTQEEDSFTQHIDYTRTTAHHLKSLSITLQSLIAAQQTAILAHDAFAASVKRIAQRSSAAAAGPALTTPRSGGRAESGGGALAAIEEMSAAFAEGASAAVVGVKGDERSEDEKRTAGAVTDSHSHDDAKTATSAMSHLTIQPPTAAAAGPAGVNLVPAFYPYTRRHLSGRLVVSDAYSSLLNSIATLQAASLKSATAAIQQLEIDRLHYDACQTSLRLLTQPAATPTSGGVQPPPTPTTPHASDPTLSDDKRRVEYEGWLLKVDSAHLTYLRSKAAVEERVDELRNKVRDAMQRGLSVAVAIERYEVEAARQLLADERAGVELSGRKKTNPAAVGVRKSGGRDDGDDEDGGEETAVR